MKKQYIILPAVVAVAVVASIKIYFWWSLTSIADALVQSARPVAQVTYGGTTSSLTGAAGIADIRITPRGYDTPVDIGAVTLDAGSLAALFDISRKVRTGEPPDAMALTFHDVSLPLSGRLAEEHVDSRGLWSTFGLPFDAAACGERSGFSALDYRRMGESRIQATITFRYELDRPDEQIHLSATVDEHGNTWRRLTVDLPMPEAMGSPRELVELGPTVDSAALEYEDRGWHARFRRFCSDETGRSESAFADAHAEAVRNTFAGMGIDMGDALERGYRALLTDNGRFELRLQPSRSVLLTELQYYSPNDAVYLLNPTLEVNGDPVPTEQVTASEQAAFARQREDDDHPGGTETDNPPADFIRIPGRELGKHIGRTVRVTVRGGQLFEGRLESVGSRTVRLTENTAAGDYEAIVPIFEIEAVSVETPGK